MGPSLLTPLFLTVIIMNRLFKNKRKQSPETSLQSTFTDTPVSIAAGPVTSINVGSGGGQELGSEVDEADLIVSPDEMSDGVPQIAYQDRINEDCEPAVVAGASGAAISGAEQRNSRKGKTSNPCDCDRSSRGPVFFSPLDEDTGYTGGITNEPTERTTGMCTAATTASAHFLHPLVAKRARKGTLLGDVAAQVDTARVVTERFGPLKVVLGTIPAFYENSEVR